MKYKSFARVTKTFYGVQIKPGEVKDFPGYINHPKFMRIDDIKSGDSKPKQLKNSAPKEAADKSAQQASKESDNKEVKN